jgi:serine/threonine-protein kinase RsbW
MPGTRSEPLVAEQACWLPRHRKSAGVARRLLRDFLEGMQGREQYAESGELILSELVANAVCHSRVSPGRLIWVRFQVADDMLRLEVHDAGGEPPLLRKEGSDEESGRGLLLVEELSAAWGWYPRVGGVGKVVWAVCGPNTDLLSGGRSQMERQAVPKAEGHVADGRGVATFEIDDATTSAISAPVADAVTVVLEPVQALPPERESAAGRCRPTSPP